jgi:Zn-finger nucleic acid-binding protein
MGAALSFLFTPSTAIVGASGAIFGVLLGYAHYWPKDQIYIWGVLPVEARWFVIVLTGLSLFGGFGGTGGNVAHFAHLGGFLGGWFYVRWLDRGHRERLIPRDAALPSPSSVDLKRWSAIRREGLHEVNREEYDRIMAKLRVPGTSPLTQQEREFLDRFSQA